MLEIARKNDHFQICDLAKDFYAWILNMFNGRATGKAGGNHNNFRHIWNSGGKVFLNKINLM